MQVGFVGFGRMGSRMVEKLLSDGHHVIGWNRSKPVLNDFRLHLEEKKYEGNFLEAATLEDMVKNLKTPRVIWLMLPAGLPTQTVLDEIVRFVKKGDIIIDGANAFYKDTQKRSEAMEAKGIRFLGIGVSGGVKAAINGYPMMIGGNNSAYEEIEPLLTSLSKPHGGYEYFGPGGAGHFVKMVHNGIEYGMMQAIGEGFGVLEKAPYTLDLLKTSQLWQKSTIISSFLIDCATDALQKDPDLSLLEGDIDANGEAEWTVNQANEEGVFSENIQQSLDFRRRSKKDKKVRESFAARMVAALRQEFGGHSVKKKE